MGEQVKEFETINTELNHENADQKGIYKKNKLILIISATLIAIILFVVLLIAVIIPNFKAKEYQEKAKEYQEKLDIWVSIMNSAEERKKYDGSIEDLHIELGFAWNSQVKDIPMDALREYILTHDVDKILIAASNADLCGSYHEARWVVFEAIYDLYPEKFQKVVLDENATSGYYIDNPTASPGVTREVESSNRPGYMNSYKVTHYGDYAVLEETYWVYDDGELGWVNGVFHDIPGHWRTETCVSVYYKGNSFDLFYNKSFSELEDIIFYETDTYIYKFGYFEGHLDDAGAYKKATD